MPDFGKATYRNIAEMNQLSAVVAEVAMICCLLFFLPISDSFLERGIPSLNLYLSSNLFNLPVSGNFETNILLNCRDIVLFLCWFAALVAISPF